MKCYVVMTNGDDNKVIPIAWSRDKAKAVEFANESYRDCIVKTVNDVTLLGYCEQYYLIEIVK